jgi:ABC-type transport system involved in cytochrome c biogenesis permease subunit
LHLAARLLELRLVSLAGIGSALAIVLYGAGLFPGPGAATGRFPGPANEATPRWLRAVRRGASTTLFVTWLLYSLALALRGLQAQRLPLQSRYDLLLWFAWWLLLVYLVVEDRARVTLPGLLLSALSLLVAQGGLLSADPALLPVLPQQHNFWFQAHAAVLYPAYAFLVVAVAIELSSPFYGLLTGQRRVRVPGPDPSERLERYLEFRSYAYRLVLLAFPLLSFALVSNALWRSSVRGHYWAWGQEETWTLITWLLFACYLHLRTQARTSRALTLTVAGTGLLAIAFTFTGVNWLVRLLRLG